MRRDHERHPFFETLVFGLAIVLAIILLFYGARAYFNYRAGDQQDLRPPSRDVSTAPSKSPGELEHDLDVGPPERGVDTLPPVKIDRPGKASHKAAAVPTPQ